jgi:hypothetical protein
LLAIPPVKTYKENRPRAAEETQENDVRKQNTLRCKRQIGKANTHSGQVEVQGTKCPR